MRGRLLLAGIDADHLSAGQLIDAAEAAIMEPLLHGGRADVDTILRKFAEVLDEAVPDRASWGTSEAQQASARAAETTFGQAAPRSG